MGLLGDLHPVAFLEGTVAFFILVGGLCSTAVVCGLPNQLISLIEEAVEGQAKGHGCLF